MPFELSAVKTTASSTTIGTSKLHWQYYSQCTLHDHF